MLAVRVFSSALGALRVRLSRQGVRLLSELPTLRQGKIQGRRRNLRFLAEAVVARDSPVLGLACNVDAVSDTVMELYGAALVSIRDEGPRRNSKKRNHRRNGSNSSTSSFTSIIMGGHIIPQSTNQNLLTSDGNNNDNDQNSNNAIVTVGDVLLVEVFPRCVSVMSDSDFTLVTAVPGSRPPRAGTTMDVIRMYVAGLALTAMVTLYVENVFSSLRNLYSLCHLY